MGDEAGQQGVLLRLVSLTGDEIKSLADAMFAVPVVRSPNGRQQVLEFVKERNPAFNPHRSDVDTEEISNFIIACRADDESFDLLLEAIETRTSRDYPNLHRLRKLVAELLPRALATAGELRESLALRSGTVIGLDQLAVGMQKAIYRHTGNGDCGLKPANVREAMLLLLDAPSPEEGEGMSTVIFVHGTGVREPAFSELFERVRRELHERRPEVGVQPCYWGGTEGARLWHDGGSVPAYDATRGIDPGPEDEELAAWDLLYQDPLWELRMLAMAGPAGSERPPWQAPPGDALDASVQALVPSAELAAAVATAGLAETFQPARVAIATSLPYRRAVAAASDGLGDLRLAVARAIVAEALAEQAEQNDVDIPVVPDAEARDRMVLLLVDDLGGRERGLPGVMVAPVRGLALRVATAQARRRRGALTDATYPGAGDILLYQARGDGIRAFIAKQAVTAAEPVVLIAHSLGGIAAVDLLVSQPLPSVRLLVTVGSQAPFLCEIGALWSLPHGDPLPAHFPPWLNIYDPRDLLSYIGAPLFPGRVEDVEVNNKQPFPQSHSAYWANPKVWDAIVPRLP